MGSGAGMRRPASPGKDRMERGAPAGFLSDYFAPPASAGFTMPPISAAWTNSAR